MGENEPVTEISCTLVIIIASLFSFFAIMTAVAGLFYLWPTNPPPNSIDVLHFTNGSTDTKAALIDGTLAADGKFKNDAKASPSPDTDTDNLTIGDYNNQVTEDLDYTNAVSPLHDKFDHTGAAIVFAYNRPPLTVVDVAWKNVSTTIDVKLPDPIEIPIKIWIVNSDNANGLTSPKITDQATSAVSLANQIYLQERQGIVLKTNSVVPNYEDKTKLANGTERPDLQFTCSFADPANAPNNIQTVIGHTPGMINVYYVAAVDRNEGISGILSTNGVWCGGSRAFDVIAIGIEASDDLLVHELGHAFSLGHVGAQAWTSYFSEMNVMHEDPHCTQVNGKWECGRKYLTEGQTYRQVINTRPDASTPGSALNDPAIYDLIPPFTPPLSPPYIPPDSPPYCMQFIKRELMVDGLMPPGWIKQPIKSKCPVLEKRIWADGTMLPN